MTIREELRALRLKHLRWALARTEGNIRQASKMIGMNSTTFARWMRELELDAFAAQLRDKRIHWLAD